MEFARPFFKTENNCVERDTSVMLLQFLPFARNELWRVGVLQEGYWKGKYELFMHQKAHHLLHLRLPRSGIKVISQRVWLGGRDRGFRKLKSEFLIALHMSAYKLCAA